MPRASKRPISKTVQAELKDNFSYLISSLSTSTDIQHFFEFFLTTEEKTMLTKRLMLHLMFENKYSSSEIAAVLSLSRETIRNHKVKWQRVDPTYKAIIVKIAKRQRTKSLWKKIEKALRPLDYALQAKSNMKARAKMFGNDFE